LACASAAPSPPAGNLSRFCDPRLDAAVERAARTPGAAPIAAWRRIEQRIADASPIVPILNLRSAVLVSKRTGDVQFQPILGVLLDRIWVR
jgi:ABC-type transport system substrate-binding protein